MSILGYCLSISGLALLILGVIGVIFPELLRDLIRYFTVGAPLYIRRLFLVWVAAFSLLVLEQLAISYRQPVAVGDVVIFAVGLFSLSLFGYLSFLSAGKLAAFRPTAYLGGRASGGVLRLLAAVMVLLSYCFFAFSGQY